LEKTAAPTKQELDTLAQLYVDAKAQAKNATDTATAFRNQLDAMVILHGFCPAGATKSRRMEGYLYIVTRSSGQRVEVNGTQIQSFKSWLKENSLSRLFSKLFRLRSVYVMSEDAQAVANEFLAKMQNKKFDAEQFSSLFHQCFSIESNSSTIKVEPKNKNKEKPSA